MDRRAFLTAAMTLAAAPAAAQGGPPAGPSLPRAPSSSEPFAALRGSGAPHHLTPAQEAQRVTDSPAPPGPAGPGSRARRCRSRAARWPGQPRWDGPDACRRRLRRGRASIAPTTTSTTRRRRWFDAAPLPRGANHVAVAADAGRVYALGGFLEQNRNPDPNAYAYEVAADRWSAIAPLPRPRGAAAAVALDGRIHLIGGAADPAAERASVGWHRSTTRRRTGGAAQAAAGRPRPRRLRRASTGASSVGGRFNTFEYNTDLHHVYLPDRDTWELRAPLPTPRSGHGLALYRDRLFAMGGEGGVIEPARSRRRSVFGQMESYDPATDTWQSHAPMPTPRHAVGAAAIGDRIYVAGGGAVTGGAVQSAVHEAFSPG